MAATHVMTVTNGVVAFYDVPAAYPLDLATADTLCCCAQVTTAAIVATDNTTDVPATFCTPASTRAVASSFSLNVEGIQDWGRGDGEKSFSEFLFENDGGQVLAVLLPESGGEVKAVAEVSVKSGDFLGPAGETLVFTGEFGCNGYPDIFVGPSPGTLLRKGQGGSTTAAFPVTGTVTCPAPVILGATEAEAPKQTKQTVDA